MTRRSALAMARGSTVRSVSVDPCVRRARLRIGRMGLGPLGDRLDRYGRYLYTCGITSTMTLDATHLDRALRATGERLAAAGGTGRARLYVIGGSAGLLSGWLSGARSTGDVDVTEVEPAEAWDAVVRAAAEVAGAMGLPATWLNDTCRMYAWCLPIGWKERCEPLRAYGSLEVWRINRQDFIAAKVVSAPSRPQDFEDLLAVTPTAGELDFTDEHLDRLERESLDPGQSFEDARAIVESLRGAS